MSSRATLITSLLAVVLSLAGCIADLPGHLLDNFNPLSRLSTAASMRVEVEVYKGPLSKNVSVQWGELNGLVDEAADALTTFNDGIVTAASTFGYVTDCTTCKVKVSIDPHYRSKKIAKKNEGKILPRTKRPEIDTRTVKKVGTASIHTNDLSKKGKTIKWCASIGVQENKQSLIGCHILSNMHDDIRVLLEELRDLHKIMHCSSPVGPLKNTAVDNFNKVSNQVYGCSGAVASTADHDILLVSVSPEQRKRIMQQVARVAMKLKAKAMYWAETQVGLAPCRREVRIAIATFANLASEYSNQLESLADGLQWQLGEEGKGINAKQLPLSVYLRNAETTDFLNLYTWNRAAAPAIWEEMLLHPSTAFSSEETADRVRVIERLMADYNWEKVNTVYGSGQGDFAMALIKDEIGNWNLKSFDSDPTELIEAYTKLARTVALTAISGVPLLPTEIEGTTGFSNVLNMNALHKRVVEKLKTIEKKLKTIETEASTSTVTRGQKNEVIKQIRAVLNDYEAEIDILQEFFITFKVQ